jgi:hypothetical protein
VAVSVSTAEREAAVRLLQELHRAAAADLDSERVWTMLGYIGVTAKLSAEDLRMQTGADRHHEHADRLTKQVAELEQRAH